LGKTFNAEVSSEIGPLATDSREKSNGSQRVTEALPGRVDAIPERLITAARLADLVQRVFAAAGSHPDEAQLIACHLVDANLVGHDSHGLMRVARYVDLARAGLVVPNQTAQVITDRGANLLIDGQFGYGQAIGVEAMRMAAERAGAHGVAIVALRNSGHLGRIGAWAEILAGSGLISLHFVNSSGFGILVAPHGGADRRLSSNPIAMGAPGLDGSPLILDIATSAIAEGKIQVARNRGERLRPGDILDGEGRPTTDPDAFYADPPGAILPFAGHKGAGLAIFCELLAGSLTGGFASNPDSPTAKQLVNNMLTIAIDPASFAGREFFAADIERFAEWMRGSPPREHGGRVLLPGERAAATRRERLAHGISIDPATWATFRATAITLGVDVDE
jgi:hydroxycarboxylate dehydrogenase B